MALNLPPDTQALDAFVLSPTFAINGVASIVAFALLVVALVAAYDREASEAGGLGVVALVAAIIGTVFMAGDWWFEAFAVPRMAALAPELLDTFKGGRLLIGGVSSIVLFGIGWAMFGIASLRARVYPAALSVTILAAGLVSGVPIGVVYVSGQAVLGLAIVWLGAWMLRTSVIASATVEPAQGPRRLAS